MAQVMQDFQLMLPHVIVYMRQISSALEQVMLQLRPNKNHINTCVMHASVNALLYVFQY